MGKIGIATVVIAVMLLGAGCRTSRVTATPAFAGQTTSQGRAAEKNLAAENYGYFLFGLLPLWSGDPTRPNAEFYWMFRNGVTERSLERMIFEAAEAGRKDDVVDYRSESVFTGAWSLFIIWRKVMTAEAVLARPNPEK